MNEATGTSALDAMDQAIRAYAVPPETWMVEHDQIKTCWDLQDSMLTGRAIYRALCELDAGIQAIEMKRACTRPAVAADHMMRSYSSWLEGSERALVAIEEMRSLGHEIEGYEEFLLVVEEGRATVGNLELEAMIPSIENMQEFVRPDNPDPARYGR